MSFKTLFRNTAKNIPYIKNPAQQCIFHPNHLSLKKDAISFAPLAVYQKRQKTAILTKFETS
jgi:hypothetical protein